MQERINYHTLEAEDTGTLPMLTAWMRTLATAMATPGTWGHQRLPLLSPTLNICKLNTRGNPGIRELPVLQPAASITTPILSPSAFSSYVICLFKHKVAFH